MICKGTNPIYRPLNILNIFDQPPTPDPLTPKQERVLLGLIAHVGLPNYRVVKAQVGIDVNLALPRLSKREASQLIAAILRLLETRR